MAVNAVICGAAVLVTVMVTRSTSVPPFMSVTVSAM